MSSRIYLDHAATTPMLPAARDAMVGAMERWANPSSPHAEGRAARAALEDARERVRVALGWQGSVIFTGGASEAAAIALGRGRATRTACAISAVEHDAVRRAAPDAAILPVDAGGIVDIDAIPAGAIVAVQTVNSETGVIQPHGELARRVRELGSVWLADAAQSAGKMALPDAGMVIVSAHKLGGPIGTGALLVEKLADLSPTGGQEKGYRAGTENLPAILGFAAALEARPSRAHITALRATLDRAIVEAGGEIVAEAGPRLPEISSYRMPGVSATAQLIEFDSAGLAVSAGSACSSGSLRPSGVLSAMGWSEPAAREVIRVSFGPQTNENEVQRFIEIWRRLHARRRAA
jgi:cysteine desulfurase